MGEYERYIKMSRDLGFTAFKLHAWGDVKRDIELSTNLRKWVGPDADLMFDGSAGWDYVEALEFGKAIQDLGFLWYEEPMREFYLGAYTKLCDKAGYPGAGGRDVGRRALEHGELDRGKGARHDARVVLL